MIALLRPNAKEKAKNETYLNENVVISGNIAQLPGECNLCNVSEQACCSEILRFLHSNVIKTTNEIFCNLTEGGTKSERVALLRNT